MSNEVQTAMTGVLGLTLAASLMALPAAATAQSVIRGEASYRERIALPPEAVFEATLEDVSRQDVSAVVLGSVRVEGAKTPIRFEIPYDPSEIDERMSYAVRGRILVGDRMMFTTDQVYPVLTRGAGTEVKMLLVRARRGRPAPSAAPLLETRWKLVRLGDDAVEVADPKREPHLILLGEPPRVAGYGGCNPLAGEYELDGNRLRFGSLATTMRACIDGMDIEAAFHAALEKVRSFAIRGSVLEMRDETGEVVAVLEATPVTGDSDG
jgi:putative lipoprotein